LPAALVAVILSVPAFAGAVYTPEELMLPRAAVQTIEVLVVVPWTLALNCSVPSVAVEADAGEMVTEVAVEPVVAGGPTVDAPGFADTDPAHPDHSGMLRTTDTSTHARLRFSSKDFMWLLIVPFDKMLIYNAMQTDRRLPGGWVNAVAGRRLC
jgi:hypothetical protein